MKVLIGYSACQLTREAFEAHGHAVWTCDLLPSRGSQERHLQCDIWDALRSRAWHLAVLHPMCTFLTVSAAWAFNDPDFQKHQGVGYHQKIKPGTLVGAARRAAREEAINNFRRLLELPFPVCAENPSPSFLNTAVRPPDQVIHPWQFGNDASKSTGLWLTKGLPPLRSTSFCEPRWVRGKGRVLPRWSNQTDSGQNKLTPSTDRWLQRSETYPGIAAAMGDQWGRWLNSLQHRLHNRKNPIRHEEIGAPFLFGDTP